MSEFIVERPDLQTFKQRYGYSLLVWFGWITWFHLWQPLFTLLGWGSSFWIVHHNLLNPCSLDILWDYIRLFLFLGIIMIGWLPFHSQINNRQSPNAQFVLVVNSQEIAADFGITPNKLASLQTAKRITMSLDDNGKIRQIESIIGRI